MYRLPEYGHNVAVEKRKIDIELAEKRGLERTNLGSIDNLVVFERIEIILDMYRWTFLDRTPKERVGGGWSLYIS